MSKINFKWFSLYSQYTQHVTLPARQYTVGILSIYIGCQSYKNCKRSLFYDKWLKWLKDFLLLWKTLNMSLFSSWHFTVGVLNWVSMALILVLLMLDPQWRSYQWAWVGTPSQEKDFKDTDFLGHLSDHSIISRWNILGRPMHSLVISIFTHQLPMGRPIPMGWVYHVYWLNCM